jgi:hypothetical protein
MKDIMRGELGALTIVDRSTFQAETLCGFEIRLMHEKATRLQPPAGGCPWSKWIVQHRLSARAVR